MIVKEGRFVSAQGDYKPPVLVQGEALFKRLGGYKPPFLVTPANPAALAHAHR